MRWKLFVMPFCITKNILMCLFDGICQIVVIH